MKTSLALLLISLLGCSEASPTYPLVQRIEGTWILRSVNGATLPVTIADTATLSGRFVAGGGQFTSSSVIRTPSSSASSSATAEKTDSQSGGIYCGRAGCSPLLLIFRISGESADAMVDGDSLTVSQPGRILVYARE